MLIYVPVTNFEKENIHDCKEIESTEAVFCKATLYSDNIRHDGWIYNGDNIFKNPEGVTAFWNGNVKEMMKHEIKASEIEWKKSI